MGRTLKSIVVRAFWKNYADLPESVKRTARKNYALWSSNPWHDSLQFKCVGRVGSVYSIRIGIGWRALAAVDGETATWFWIGSHSDYDSLIART